ncbi:hypothetical protein BDA99DRAFT_505327 [Phascolomyces articulosus]|uniref:ASX DEUBAD domain-containing protein n=1 Tax=Phascolomyces articulosus TaxID=60185 RepID=A0AAD5KDD4_9FUNG|nr:hypothetical protein BDA99DRAFT_505327 [Phascolomyces articulosus]
MTTLKRLIQDSNSPLVKVELKEALQSEIFDRLPVDAVEALYNLLPLADLVFVRAKSDHGPDDRLEIIYPESIDQVNTLKDDPWCVPYISQNVFDNPDFRVAWEDFLVLLSDGYYEQEEEEDDQEEEEQQPIADGGKGKRKRKNTHGEENPYKDDEYERYWGERIEKQQKEQQKKKKGRAPKPKNKKQNQEESEIIEEFLDHDRPKAKRGRPKKQ